jgi:hypothetical protein
MAKNITKKNIEKLKLYLAKNADLKRKDDKEKCKAENNGSLQNNLPNGKSLHR